MKQTRFLLIICILSSLSMHAQINIDSLIQVVETKELSPNEKIMPRKVWHLQHPERNRGKH